MKFVVRAQVTSLLSVTLLGSAAGCDEGDVRGVGAADVSTSTRDMAAANDIDRPFDPVDIAVGASACCLTVEGERAVFSEGGDLFMIDLATGVRTLLVGAPGDQVDPVLEGDRLVWADGRGGDLDLWTLTFDEGEPSAPRLLRGGPGDQAEPALDGTRVVWIGRDAAPHTALEAEVWTLDLGVANSERRLTFDGAEQTQPDVDDDIVVWADYSMSPAGRYLPDSDPLKNNADILGKNLRTDEGLELTRNLSKQLRPAIDKDVVVWLDWRDINPEPKYSEFQVFVRRLGDAVERRLAWSSWKKPELWRRPAVKDGLVVFIAEPTALADPAIAADPRTNLIAVEVDFGEPWVVVESPTAVESVVVTGDRAAWLGGGRLGVKALRGM